MIKIAFFDIDGTLISHKLGGAPASAKEAVRALRSRGVKTFIATGRHITGVRQAKALSDMTFDGYVTMNGQYCFDSSGVIYDNPLDPADVRRMVEHAEKHSLTLGMMEAAIQYVNQHTDALRRIHDIIHVAPPPVKDLEARCGEKIYQMIVYASDEEISSLPPLAHTRATRWILGGADLVPSEGSKAVGIAHVLDYYGIDKSEAICFGDGENDIEMFSAVGTAVAMGNAADSVKQHADIVTDDVEDDGIYNALVKLGVI